MSKEYDKRRQVRLEDFTVSLALRYKKRAGKWAPTLPVIINGAAQSWLKEELERKP